MIRLLFWLVVISKGLLYGLIFEFLQKDIDYKRIVILCFVVLAIVRDGWSQASFFLNKVKNVKFLRAHVYEF